MARRTSTRKLQDVVNRLRMKQSIKAIKHETGKHRSMIRRLLLLAEQQGWLDEQHAGEVSCVCPQTGEVHSITCRGCDRIARR